VVQGGTNGASATASAAFTSLTTTDSNSIIIGVISDWNGMSGALSFRDAPVVNSLDFLSPSKTRGIHFYNTNSTVGLHNVGLLSPTSGGSSITVLEIKK